MKPLFFILIFLQLLSSSSCSKKKEKIKHRAEAKKASVAQILKLHDGVLLVRLMTKKNTINAMKKVKKLKLANKTEAKLKERNQSIVCAFRNHFNFCPVYFFYSDYSIYVKDNQFERVVFLDDSLILDSSIKVLKQPYLIAEFGSVYPDTTTYSTSHYFDYGKKQTTHYGGSGITVSALIIKDKLFTQLKEPFPYHVRERKKMLFFSKKIHKVVLRMSNRLEKYYRKTY
jgi:hypothetical protein